jgi:antitoxin VapB
LQVAIGCNTMLLQLFYKDIKVAQTYTTRQFRAGNSQAVRLPATVAFAPRTELIVTREGDKIIVQPAEKTMANLPQLFSALKNVMVDEKLVRPEFVEAQRNGHSSDGELGS